MKKALSILTVLALVAALAACSGTPATTPGSSSSSGTSQSTSASQSSTSDTSSASSSTGAPSFDIPVPDFLDAQQQQLYYDAYHMFIGFDLNSGFDEQDNSAEPYTDASGNVYYKMTTETFASWDDFESKATAVFTKEYFEELNEYPTYISVDGDLYCAFGARGANIEWLGPDTFELISQTDDRIEFDVVGTYQEWEDNDKDEWVQTGDIYTETHALVMVKENGGWRFSKFSLSF